MATVIQLKDAICDSKKGNNVKSAMWWIKENYEYAEEVSIPRKIVYENYMRCCSRHNRIPISAATFGKIIRQQFPQMKTRRLGVRGQSKYHYHGLAIRATSSDFDPAYSKILPADSDSHTISTLHPKNRSDSVKSMKISIPNDGILPVDGTKSDMKHFLIMYQTHSQQMLDSIIQGCFDEVGKFLTSFWRGCPDNFKYLFDDSKLISCVIFLDIQVYLSVSYSVLPSMDQSLPEMYLKDFLSFLCRMTSILSLEIADSYHKLKYNKLKYTVMFKQLCINWLKASYILQTIYSTFDDTIIISQMLEDFQTVDLEDVIYHVVAIIGESERAQFWEHFHYYFEDLENILERGLSVDLIICWCKMVFSQEWTKDYRNLFLGWSKFLSSFLKELLFQRSSSFAHVNLIFTWLEYLLYIQCTVALFKNFRISSEDLLEDDSETHIPIISENNIYPDGNVIKYTPGWYDPSMAMDQPITMLNSVTNYRMSGMDHMSGYRESILEENIQILWNL